MTQKPDVLTQTAAIVAAFVGNNNMKPAEVVELIRGVRTTLAESDQGPEINDVVSDSGRIVTGAEIRKSITEKGLVSFIDGRPYKMLKLHLTRHGLTIADYRKRFGLPADYPSTSPAYSAMRSEIAKTFGLGALGRKAKAVQPPAKATPATKKTSGIGRKAKA